MRLVKTDYISTINTCTYSIIPMRAEASDKAEMVNQLLFGEHYKIIEKTSQMVENSFGA